MKIKGNKGKPMTTLTTEEKEIILDSIRDIPDFPKPGIIFKDITTLLSNPKALNTLMTPEASYLVQSWQIDLV